MMERKVSKDLMDYLLSLANYLGVDECIEDKEMPDMVLAIRIQRAIKKLEGWVSDLQSGMYISCVYCGHRYGPKEDTPVTMADVLKEHIEKCPKHPLSKVTTERDALIEERDALLVTLDKLLPFCKQGVKAPLPYITEAETAIKDDKK